MPERLFGGGPSRRPTTTYWSERPQWTISAPLAAATREVYLVFGSDLRLATFSIT